MRKLTPALVLAVSVTACTDTKTINDFEAYCQTIDSTTIVLKRVNNVEEFQKITAEFAKTAQEFEERHKDAVVAEELLQQLKIASAAYQEAANAKIKEFETKNVK